MNGIDKKAYKDLIGYFGKITFLSTWFCQCYTHNPLHQGWNWIRCGMDISMYIHIHIYFFSRIQIWIWMLVWCKKFISVFILNEYRYKSDTKSIDINIDISYIIKFYDHRIKDISKWIVNQINKLLIWLWISLKS